MSLRERLGRLQRRVETLMDGRVVSCLTCQRSLTTARMVALVDEPEDELHDCPDCGLRVAPDGVPVGHLGPDGSYKVKVIRLAQDPEEAGAPSGT